MQMAREMDIRPRMHSVTNLANQITRNVCVKLSQASDSEEWYLFCQ